MRPKLPRYNCHRHRARNAARHPAALLDRPVGRYGDDPGDLATKPSYADGRRDPRRQPRPRSVVALERDRGGLASIRVREASSSQMSNEAIDAGPRPTTPGRAVLAHFCHPKITQRTNVVSPPRGRPKDPQQQTDFE